MTDHQAQSEAPQSLIGAVTSAVGKLMGRAEPTPVDKTIPVGHLMVQPKALQETLDSIQQHLASMAEPNAHERVALNRAAVAARAEERRAARFVYTPTGPALTRPSMVDGKLTKRTAPAIRVVKITLRDGRSAVEMLPVQTFHRSRVDTSRYGGEYRTYLELHRGCGHRSPNPPRGALSCHVHLPGCNDQCGHPVESVVHFDVDHGELWNISIHRPNGKRRRAFEASMTEADWTLLIMQIGKAMKQPDLVRAGT